MKKKISIGLVILALIILVCSISTSNNKEIKSIKSERELKHFYHINQYSGNSYTFLEQVLLLPFSLLLNDYTTNYEYNGWSTSDGTTRYSATKDATYDEYNSEDDDYSETNIQVEGVDEADIIKTDGKYIYSISGTDVVITNVEDSANVRVVARITKDIPNDIMLYENKLVVISSDDEKYSYQNNTIVDIYDITKKEKPTLVKSFELYEPYYTTRCIEGKLYVLSEGHLRMKDKKVSREYKEDNKTKEIKLNDIKYLTDDNTGNQTLIGEIDLNNMSNLKLSSYLIDMDNAYVSKENIYLANELYGSDNYRVKDLFGYKGVLALFDFDEDLDDYEQTSIYKFKLDDKKVVSYVGKKEIEGSLLNQYSFDEKDGNLRVALEGNDGTRVAILDKKLKLISETEPVAENEIMYSSRFIGDRAYFVTYRNTDPLFVVDLSDVKNPKIMGELKIPGYSTYLHPYDDNHLIGIGMETREEIERDDDGSVISTSAVITGMKMSLFDVSDIKNPKQISKTTIGDSRTVSAILTNPKALLFSKEKNLIAIPVNNFEEDFAIEEADDMEEDIYSFVDEMNDYISEGYFVYNIDLKDGFKLKGVIYHDKTSNDYYYYDSKLLRGLYIKDNLFTVSEEAIKVNKLSDLEQISELSLKEEGDK